MAHSEKQATKKETSGIFSHSLIYAAGNVMRQLVGFIMLPIYTNYLSPADYGVIGLLIFALSLIDLVFGARLLQSVPKFYYEKESKEERNATVSSALILTTCISTLTMLIVMLLNGPASSFLFSSDGFDLVIGFFAVQILTTALENYGLLYIRIERRPWLFVSFGAGKLILQLGMNIWLVVFLEMGVLGIAIAGAVSTGVFACLLGLYTVVKVGLAFRWHLAWEQVKFCIPLWVAGFAALYTGSANRYYMNQFATLTDIGLFELAVKFSAILSTLVWIPFFQYWQTESFSIYNSAEKPKQIYRNVFQFVTLLLTSFALGISLFSRPVIRLMADSSYYAAADAVPILTFAGLFQCLVFYVNFSFMATNNTNWISKINYFVAAVATVLYLTLVPLLGFVGAALALLLIRMVQFVVTFIKAKAYYDMRLELMPFISMLVISCIGIVVADTLPSVSIAYEVLYKMLLFVPIFLGLCASLLLSAENRSMAMHYWQRVNKRPV